MIRPARLKAGVEDDRVQSVLAQAVMNEENPGTRLQAINTIGAYRNRLTMKSQALIRAARTTQRGVQTGPLRPVSDAFDEDIKQACLYCHD
jgi:hypothetical protein